MQAISDRAVRGSVDVGGVAVSFYDSESAVIADGTRAPIVLLHGTGGSALAHYGLIYPVLELNQRVTAIDFGQPADPADLTLEGLVAQARGVIEHLFPGEPVTLVGYSLGAVVAAALAGSNPAHVRNLVLIAGWAATDDQQRLRNSVWNALYDAGNRQALAEFTVFAAFSAPFLRSMPPERLSGIVASIAPGAFEAAQMRVNHEVDIAADVAKIVAPTLVIGCARDQMVPVAHSKALFGAITDSRYYQADCGHAIIYERAAELAMLIDQFNEDPAQHAADSRIAADRP